jgi:predicted phosphoribosyltransferase
MLSGEQSLFYDRIDAGTKLVESLQEYRGNETCVFAIPRGGVPVSVEVAKGLNSYLDIVVPRKITIPYNPEAGYGAVTEDGTIFLNKQLVESLGLTEQQIQRQAEGIHKEIKRRSALYHSKLQAIRATIKTAIVIDDGLASGYTALAAVKSIRRRNIPKIVVASPVVSGAAYELIRPKVDDLVSVVISHTYPFAVASFYQDWYDLSEDEVIEFLKIWKQPIKQYPTKS